MIIFIILYPFIILLNIGIWIYILIKWIQKEMILIDDKNILFAWYTFYLVCFLAVSVSVSLSLL